jgi:cytochrome b6-f complex iron-sulfur subunit
MTTSTENPESDIQKRRVFVFSSVGFALLSIFAAATAFSSNFFRTLFSAASQIDIGKMEEFETGKVDERWLAKEKFYVVKSLDSLYVLSAYDSKALPLQWSRSEEAFVSKSGQRYYKTGIQMEGENKKSIQRFALKRSAEGHILVNTTKSFRQEKGDWNHPESFLKA